MNKTIKDLILELQDLDLPLDTLVKTSVSGTICDMDFIYRTYRGKDGKVQLLLEQNLD